MNSDEVIRHYERFNESTRLNSTFGIIQFERTKELIQRYLEGTKLTILDIGGGCGNYTFWLTTEGHSVHLVDIVPHHIDQAKALSLEKKIYPASIKVGNALNLEFENESADAILFFGPMYHLANRDERLQALRECFRVLRPGGQLFIHAIGRYSGIVYGLTSGYILKEDFIKMIRTEIATGHRVNAPEWLNTFNEAHFHLPNELQEEIENCGIKCDKILGVVGLSWLLPNIEKAFQDDEKKQRLLEAARLMENEPSISPDIIAICKKEVIHN